MCGKAFTKIVFLIGSVVSLADSSYCSSFLSSRYGSDGAGLTGKTWNVSVVASLTPTEKGLNVGFTVPITDGRCPACGGLWRGDSPSEGAYSRDTFSRHANNLHGIVGDLDARCASQRADRAILEAQRAILESQRIRREIQVAREAKACAAAQDRIGGGSWASAASPSEGAYSRTTFDLHANNLHGIVDALDERCASLPLPDLLESQRVLAKTKRGRLKAERDLLDAKRDRREAKRDRREARRSRLETERLRERVSRRPYSYSSVAGPTSGAFGNARGVPGASHWSSISAFPTTEARDGSSRRRQSDFQTDDRAGDYCGSSSYDDHWTGESADHSNSSGRRQSDRPDDHGTDDSSGHHKSSRHRHADRTRHGTDDSSGRHKSSRHRHADRPDDYGAGESAEHSNSSRHRHADRIDDYGAGESAEHSNSSSGTDERGGVAPSRHHNGGSKSSRVEEPTILATPPTRGSPAVLPVGSSSEECFHLSQRVSALEQAFVRLESSGPGDGSAALSSLTEGLAAIRLELGSIRTELGSRRAESDSDLHAELDALRAKNERLVEEGTTQAKIIRIAKKAIAKAEQRCEEYERQSLAAYAEGERIKTRVIALYESLLQLQRPAS